MDLQGVGGHDGGDVQIAEAVTVTVALPVSPRETTEGASPTTGQLRLDEQKRGLESAGGGEAVVVEAAAAAAAEEEEAGSEAGLDEGAAGTNEHQPLKLDDQPLPNSEVQAVSAIFLGSRFDSIYFGGHKKHIFEEFFYYTV